MIRRRRARRLAASVVARSIGGVKETLVSAAVRVTSSPAAHSTYWLSLPTGEQIGWVLVRLLPLAEGNLKAALEEE